MGRASACHHQAGPSDPFQADSWGAQFQNIIGLKTFQLELETVEKKKPELDAIVARAPGWQFPLGDGSLLVLDQSMTRRTGWVGNLFGKVESHSHEPSGYQAQNTNIRVSGYIESESEFDDLLVPQSRDGADKQDTVDTGHHGSSNNDTLELTEERPAEAGTASSASELSTSRIPTEPSSAKQRLVADGVKFIDENLEPHLPEDKLQTYYVVTMTWCTHKDLRGQ